MNDTIRKFFKTSAKVGVGFIAFAGTLIGGYMMTPNRTKLLTVKIEERPLSAFEQFVSRVTRDIGLSKNELAEVGTVNYLSASFDDLTIQYSVENSSKVNTIKIDGGLDFRMSDISMAGIELNLNANVNYNGKELPISLGHFKNTIYMGIKDLKFKCSNFTKINFLDEYIPLFALYGELDIASMYDDFGSKLTGLLNDAIDDMLNSTTSSGLDLSGFAVTEQQVGSDWKFTLDVSDDIQFTITSDEEFAIKRVDLTKISVGGVNVSGGIDIQLKDYNDFELPNSDEYVEIFNYSGLVQKFAKLLKEDGGQKLGLAFAADLNNVSENSSTDIAYIQGSLNVDFNKLLDLEQYTIELPEELKNQSIRGNLTSKNEPTATSNIYDTIKDIGFNLQLDLLGQNNVEYANLDVVFADGEGYIRFNEQEDEEHNLKSVMKLKLDVETMNWLMNELPDVISNLSGEDNNKTLESLLDFLSDDLADAIKDGDYSFILNMIKTLKNTNDTIELDIDLSVLGIGDNAEVSVVINNNPALPTLDLDVTGLKFGNFTLDLNVDSADYSEPDMGVQGEYQSVKFIPDVIDQVAELVDNPRSGFAISGSVLDKDSLGIKFDGVGQFDNNENVKAGYGTMTIKQYKYHANTVWATHNLAVDVTNLESNVITSVVDNKEVRNNQNEALFVYGDPNGDNVKGKMHLQSFVDIFEIVKTFIKDSGDDPKYTKFLAPITKLLGMSALGDIIAQKDYLHFASNELLKEVSLFNNGSGIKIVIGGSLIGFEGDLTIKVNFEGDNDSGNQRIKSIEINDFKMGEGESVKTINLKFELQPYDESMVNHVNHNDSYMNLDGIATLLDLGINTTKLNYYELSADAKVDTILGINIKLEGIKFYIYVDGVHVKVYGKFDKVPLIVAVSEDYDLLQLDRTMDAEMTFETYDDDEKPEGDDVGGIFNIKRTTTTPKTRLV